MVAVPIVDPTAIYSDVSVLMPTPSGTSTFVVLHLEWEALAAVRYNLSLADGIWQVAGHTYTRTPAPSVCAR